MASTKDPDNPFVDDLRARIKKGWRTQGAFSQAARVDSGGLSRILRRKANAEPDTLAKIAVALGEDVVEFVINAYQLRDQEPAQPSNKRTSREKSLQRYNKLRGRLTEVEEDITLNVMERLADDLIASRSARS